MKKGEILIDVFFVILLLLAVMINIVSYLAGNTFIWIPGILMVLGLIFNWLLIRKEFNKKREEK